jgi:hypothetical protein
MAVYNQLVIIRKRGQGFAFTPYDNMILAKANKISKSGLVTRSVAVSSGELIETKKVYSLNMLPAGLTETEVLDAFPPEGWLPWEDGFKLLKKLRDNKITL